MLGILENISPSELVSNGYISNHNKVWRPRPKFKVSLYIYFCCFWMNITQINFENINRKIQRIISDCFQLKSRFNVDARAPSIPLLNFPFKCLKDVKIFKWLDLPYSFSPIDCNVGINHEPYGLSNSNLWYSVINILVVVELISKLVYSWLFIDPFEQHYTTQT